MSGELLQVVAAGALPASFPTAAFEDKIEVHVARTEEDLRSAVRNADILYSWRVPPSVPAESPRLKWIQLPSAGADHLRREPVWASSITITSSAGIHIVPMAEHFFGMLLALTRCISTFTRQQEREEWSRGERGQLAPTELRGRTLGIIGWGKIGDGIAHLAEAFGMRVVGTRWSVVVPRGAAATAHPFSLPPWLEPEDLPPHIVFPAAQVDEVLAQSDVVVVLLPLTQSTHAMFGRDRFAAMKRGAIFLNLGRGAVVQEEALIQALRSGHLAGSGLDVFEQEPLPKTSPLWAMENVIVSPHTAGVSEHTRERAAQFLAVNLTRYLEGQPLLNVVDRNLEY